MKKRHLIFAAGLFGIALVRSARATWPPSNTLEQSTTEQAIRISTATRSDVVFEKLERDQKRLEKVLRDLEEDERKLRQKASDQPLSNTDPKGTTDSAPMRK